MADLFDQAQVLEELERSRSIERARSPAVPATAAGSTPTVCECGAEIPPARRRALPGVRTCVYCAAEAERVHKLFARG